MIWRPLRVRMRARNPWVLARLRFFGWYVRFTFGALDGAGGAGDWSVGDGQYRGGAFGPPGLGGRALPAGLDSFPREMRRHLPRAEQARPIVAGVSGQASSDELTTIWEGAREELRASVPPATFELWLEPIQAVSVQGSTLFLTAPGAVRRWVERRYAERIAAAVRRQSSAIEGVGFLAEAGGGGEERTDPRDPVSTPIDPAHTFERFVIGPGNRLAHAAALAVAELPGEAYNPLFLHGPPGLGKTHLLGAIVEYLSRNHPELNVHQTTAERFTSEFVTALRHEGPQRFKQRYRELDALLIDDVQVLEGKVRTEEEFVHTFNALFAAGKQIVLSSDRPPAALAQLAERLRDRFQWGLTVELEPPDLRTRIALLWRMAARSAPELPEPMALEEIAGRVPGNVRLLEGAMTRVVATASVLSEPITTPLVRKALQAPGGGSREQVAAAAASAAPSVTAIQEAVASVLGVPREELVSVRRTPRVARARQLAMYLTRELTQLSLAQIAREFERDHSTVLHAIRSVSQRLEPGSETAEAIHKVRANLGTTGDVGLGPDDSLHDPGTPPPP
jgi:chromosomal replication initiator protein